MKDREGGVELEIDRVRGRSAYCALPCPVLYCTVQCYTALLCTALYCTVLLNITLLCTTLHHYTVLPYESPLYCTVLYCTLLLYTLLYNTALPSSTLCCTAPAGGPLRPGPRTMCPPAALWPSCDGPQALLRDREGIGRGIEKGGIERGGIEKG
jgi:hypothetical protein